MNNPMQNNLPLDKLELISIGEASEYLGISIDTLRRWEKKGRIEPLRSPGGHRYYKKEELENLFGKRYLRDEPTIRQSQAPKKTDDIQSIENPVEEKPQLPKITLPAWRAIKEEPTDDVALEKITESPVVSEEKLLDRPIREVKIPENLRIQVTRKDVLVTPEEGYYHEQSVSVLTPTIGQEQETQKPELKINSQRKKIIYISLTVALLFFGIAWYFLWKNSQTVLSPVP